MSIAPRRSQPEVKETAGDAKGLETIELSETPSQESDFGAQRNLLRQKWELASVLNFLYVFEDILGNELKISGDEVEMGLIKPDSLIAKLHILLLKGIPPVSKNLSGTDAWITALCKKLATWWPWVAEGGIPLSAAKGEEVSRYKKLDPATRLLILKALCEIRANQDDISSFINDALKKGTQLSFFRKEQIAGDGRGTTYWYDGNSDVGLRLYKEVKQTVSKPRRRKGKGNLNLPAFSLQWETLATNLEEFREVMGKYSSSKVPSEVYVAEKVESEAIPVLEKIEKKKERALKKKERQEKQILLDGFQDTYAAGFTRSCRTRRPVNYTYDDYDQAIDEALQVAKRRKTGEEPRHKETQDLQGKVKDNAVNGVSGSGLHSEDDSSKEHDSVVYDSDNDSFQDDGNNDGKDGDSDYNEEKDDPETREEFLDDDNGFEMKSKAKVHSQKGQDKESMPYRHFGSRWSSRLAGSSHPAAKNKNPVSRTRLRQRPTHNTTARSSVIPHSEDGETSENTVTDASTDEDHLSDADDGNRSSEDDPDQPASNDDPDKPASDADDGNHSSDAGSDDETDH